ncbi:dynein axonemal heavy chain 10-like [Venturia canescens]|uniref:dynein axonemal heavy chain 10-like n=1 Tax=Venturia canescens TaxID=32260 RepID=UPI001C9CDA7B|nr:dynein axonemal heavy chain 10-like [Venturia canescens]
MLVEQLKTVDVKEILSLLEESESPIASAFNFFQMELWKHYTEARDNNKFLFTVLRYFKLIAESKSFQTIAKALPPLTEGMRMIWVLSKYYSTEDKMVPLLERISWQLCQNIMKNLAIEDLFKKPLDEVLTITADAHAMMKNWRESYLNTRESIEVSGKGRRWEFDQDTLFRETEYIANVCDDLNKIASVLQDFYNIFGAELKSIINDPAQIDAIIKRVEKLTVPLENADFNVFMKFNKENWDATMSWFYAEVANLENEAKFYIDECFTVLISAEHALEVLLKFKNIKTRQAIQEQLLMKFDIIMQQFSKEISMIENIFNRGKRNPPLLPHHPPIAGAIFWERQLFHRLKDPVLKFQRVTELKNSELKLFAFQQYLNIAKQMKKFEEAKFNSWIETTSPVVTLTMKKSLLKMTPTDHEINLRTQLNKVGTGSRLRIIRSRSKELESITNITGRHTDGVISKQSIETGGSTVSEQKFLLPSLRVIRSGSKGGETLLREHKASTISSLMEKPKVAWKEILRDGTTVELQLRFEINFNFDVFEIIQEAELLEQLGFELPEIVRNVGIQKDRLRADIEATKNMIDRYNAIVSKFDEADLQLLNKSLRNIEKNIHPGVSRLNWYSLGISDYAMDCEKLLKSLSSIVTQINQMKRDLDQRIERDIQSYNLFTPTEERSETEVELSPCKVDQFVQKSTIPWSNISLHKEIVAQFV